MNTRPTKPIPQWEADVSLHFELHRDSEGREYLHVTSPDCRGLFLYSPDIDAGLRDVGIVLGAIHLGLGSAFDGLGDWEGAEQLKKHVTSVRKIPAAAGKEE